MTDLVTGASGFIGGHLAARLVRLGCAVRVLVRPGSRDKLLPEVSRMAEIMDGDLRDGDSLRRAVAGTARVFHCAAHVSDWGAASTFEAANVRGTELLYEAARAANVRRVVHMSSIAVFGTPSPSRFDDDSPYGASRDGYSSSKADGEKVAKRFSDAGLPIAILRPAVVYGPRGAWLEEPLAMVEREKLFLLGGGAGTCHPCYVENLVDATLLAAEHPRALGQAFIVGDGESVSFRSYFDAVAQIAGHAPVRRSIPLAVARALAFVLETFARLTRAPTRPLLSQTAIDMVTTKSEMSTRKIETELGFKPRYTFASAIEELRERYAEHGSLTENRRRPSPQAQSRATAR